MIPRIPKDKKLSFQFLSITDENQVLYTVRNLKEDLERIKREDSYNTEKHGDSVLFEDTALYEMMPAEFYGYNHARHQIAPSPSLKTNACTNKDIDKKKIFEAVCEFFDGDKALSRRKFPEEEKKKLITYLSHKSFEFPIPTFEDIIKISKEQKKTGKEPDRSEGFRHGALNNYDYERLKKETDLLKKRIGDDKLKASCPTLIRIIEETEATKDDPYPGRHLPFDKVTGRTAWRYQCLRIMDEKLYTTESGVSDLEMQQHIFSECEKLGIDLPPEIQTQGCLFNELMLENVLKKNYVILNELISVENTHGDKDKYARDSYEKGRRGHKYKKVTTDPNRDERVTAFKVVFSYKEALALEKELGLLLQLSFPASYFFISEFPLLSAFVYPNTMRTEMRKRNETFIKGVSHTDLFIINYYPFKQLPIIDKIDDAIRNNQLIKIGSGSRLEIYKPLRIRRGLNKWAVVAMDVNDLSLKQIHASRFYIDFSCIEPENLKEEYTPMEYDNLIVGLSDFINNNPWNITITVTESGKENIVSKDSPLYELKLEVLPLHGKFYTKEKRAKLKFNAYINEDLFKAFYKLDRNGYLIDITPNEVKHMYMDHYLRQTGKEWCPYDKRNANNKRAARPSKTQK